MIENLILSSTPQAIQKKYNIESIQCCNYEPGIRLLTAGDLIPYMSDFKWLNQMQFGYKCINVLEEPGILNLQTELVQPKEDESEFDRIYRACSTRDYCESLSQYRCVVFVDAFLVTGIDNKTYLIHMQDPNDKPFAIAGLYGYYTHPVTTKSLRGIVIITVAPNKMLSKIGAANMPVIMKPDNIKTWIDRKTERRHYIPLIHTYPDETLNGYEVSGKIFNTPLTIENIQPIGPRLKPWIK